MPTPREHETVQARILAYAEAIGLDDCYVSVHELLHFSIPNHGRLWKALMRARQGGWKEIEQQLKLNA
jgi:hypothetical protein